MPASLPSFPSSKGPMFPCLWDTFAPLVSSAKCSTVTPRCQPEAPQSGEALCQELREGSLRAPRNKLSLVEHSVSLVGLPVTLASLMPLVPVLFLTSKLGSPCLLDTYFWSTSHHEGSSMTPRPPGHAQSSEQQSPIAHLSSQVSDLPQNHTSKSF